MHATTPRTQIEHRIQDLRAAADALERQLAGSGPQPLAPADHHQPAANTSPLSGPAGPETPLPIAAG